MYFKCFKLILCAGLCTLGTSVFGQGPFKKCLQSSKLEIFNEDNIYVEVVLSPRIHKKSKEANELRLIWKSEYQKGDKIEIYNSENHPIYTLEVESNIGHVNTGKFLTGHKPQLENTLVKTVSYYAVYLRNGKQVAKSSLSNHPTWMTDMKKYIKDLHLSEVFIPGTHQSAAYYDESQKSETIYGYVFNQDMSVLQQLLMGVRYLDLRIGYNSNPKDHFWCHHDFIKMKPFRIVAEQIKQFLEFTNEIVILDFHRFPHKFNNERHIEFIKYVKDYFGDMINDQVNWGTKLKDIWSSGKRLIISYASGMRPDYAIYPDVSQAWGNKIELNELYTFLNGRLSWCNGINRYGWAAMAQLTPQVKTVFLHPLRSLRKWADRVNTNMTLAFHHEWSSCTHIAAMDFVKSTGIVSAALKENVIRYCKKNSHLPEYQRK